MTKDEIIEDFNRAIERLEKTRDEDLSIDGMVLDNSNADYFQQKAMSNIELAINYIQEAIKQVESGKSDGR